MHKEAFLREWHGQIVRFMDDADTSDWGEHRFMYEARTASGELPRLSRLFGIERRGDLPKKHKQCSRQTSEPVPDNYLTCCLGVKCANCPMLQALEGMATPDEEKDLAKAWTCVTHIVSKGGAPALEGYVVTVGDGMYWDRVHDSLARGGDTK